MLSHTFSVILLFQTLRRFVSSSTSEPGSAVALPPEPDPDSFKVVSSWLVVRLGWPGPTPAQER